MICCDIQATYSIKLCQPQACMLIRCQELNWSKDVEDYNCWNKIKCIFLNNYTSRFNLVNLFQNFCPSKNRSARKMPFPWYILAFYTKVRSKRIIFHLSNSSFSKLQIKITHFRSHIWNTVFNQKNAHLLTELIKKMFKTVTIDTKSMICVLYVYTSMFNLANQIFDLYTEGQPQKCSSNQIFRAMVSSIVDSPSEIFPIQTCPPNIILRKNCCTEFNPDFV